MKWFKVDCDITTNPDIRKLIDVWGWDWFGRYVAILAKIGRGVNEKNRSFALTTNNGGPLMVGTLSDELQTTDRRLLDFGNFLADNHLIDKEPWYAKTLISCSKMRKRTDEYTDKILRESAEHPEQEVEVDREVEGEVEKEVGEREFEEIWNQYPDKSGKKRAIRHFLASVKTADDVAKIKTAIQNYLASERVSKGFIKNGSTWFNEWQDWVEPTQHMMGSGNQSTSKGFRFDQRSYPGLKKSGTDPR